MDMDTIQKKIQGFIWEGVDLSKRKLQFESDSFWQALRKTGTELWLDTGDMDAAAQLWTAEMSALTTNNTLLNKEIQKGIYDEFIKKANTLLGGLALKQRVVEIAFILNAHHGLKLVERFGGKVSVELHTDLAHDLQGILRFGKRFHDICPDHFIIKVPLTATGFLGAKALKDHGVPVNFTLGFSARHNYIAAIVAKPHYGNVFLGRLNSYIAENGLGTGTNVGEKATISSQRHLIDLRNGGKTSTKQIAASMRSGSQVHDLAGVDVFTMPTKVAGEAKQTLNASQIKSRLEVTLDVELAAGIDPSEVKLEKTFEVSDEVKRFAESVEEETPPSGEELVNRAHETGCGDLFPILEEAELNYIAEDGKIPKHDRWKAKIQKDEIAVDTLLNLGGLASFTADQASLDDRIKGLIS